MQFLLTYPGQLDINPLEMSLLRMSAPWMGNYISCFTRDVITYTCQTSAVIYRYLALKFGTDE